MKKTNRKNLIQVPRTCDNLVSQVWNLAVAEKQRVGVICLSMSKLEFINRLIAKGSQLPIDKILKGNLTPEEWHLMTSAIEALKGSSIILDDTMGKTYQQRIDDIRQMARENEVTIVFIDSQALLFSDMDILDDTGEKDIRTLLNQLAEELDITIEACP